MKKITLALLVSFATVFAICGCKNDDSNEEKKSVIDYADHSSGDYVVKVTNNTAKKLVAFKGTSGTQNLIGGVPATSANHGLARSRDLFPASADSVLFFITEEQYLENKDNLGALAEKPFARLYAYYNSNARNNNVYQISTVMGGEGSLILQNNTQYNVELRRNSIYGETIGYTSAETFNTVFNVNYDSYLLFPVFRKFDTNINEIVTVYPRYSSGLGIGKPVSCSVAVTKETPARTLNASEWLQSNSQIFSSAYAYITIENNARGQDISLYAGSEALTTSSGYSYIPYGQSKTFTLEMETLTTDQSTGVREYATSRDYAAFHVGNEMHNALYLGSLSNNPSTVRTYEAGKKYVFVINLVENGSSIFDMKLSEPQVFDMTF